VSVCALPASCKEWFQTLVFNLANGLGISGWVRNTSSGVEIEADGPVDALKRFVRAVQHDAPPLARIDECTVTYGPSRGLSDSGSWSRKTSPKVFQPISPDVAAAATACMSCSSGGRRYRYPFINCTNCGPRFTIIKTYLTTVP